MAARYDSPDPVSVHGCPRSRAMSGLIGSSFLTMQEVLSPAGVYALFALIGAARFGDLFVGAGVGVAGISPGTDPFTTVVVLPACRER